MGNLVNAYVLFNSTTDQYVGDRGMTITLNCDKLNAFSPRPVWLKRFVGPGDGTIVLYEITFNPSSAEILDPNILSGFMIQQEDQTVMIDITSANILQAACDACCGGSTTVLANNYAGAPTAFAPPTLTTLCIYRFDDGSAGAHDDFAADYVGQFVGTAQVRSNFSGVSHYTLTTYWTLLNFPLQYPDTIYAGACGS